MKAAIIISKKDPAGMNIKKNLIDLGARPSGAAFAAEEILCLHDDATIFTIQDDTVYCEHLDDRIDADVFIFATKHQSASGIPSLSVHAPGNWGRTEFGGKDRTLCTAPANMIGTALGILVKKAADRNLRHEVIQEITHHGPYLDKPCMFIEIGSSQIQWREPLSGKVIAETIIELLRQSPKAKKIAIGIGGPHHAPNFRKITLHDDISIGHICPKYCLENLDEAMLDMAMEKNMEGRAELAILDWKGLGSEKQRIKALLDKMGITYKKTSDFSSDQTIFSSD